MLFTALLKWWYTRGWLAAARHAQGIMRGVAADFSLLILLKTLFAPWKQLVTYTSAKQSLPLRLRAFIDNLVSRFVGFLVRSSVLLVAGLGLVVLALLSGVLLVAWPLFPLAFIGLVGKGFGWS